MSSKTKQNIFLMLSKKKISIVIPAFNIGENIIFLLDSIPEYVDKIYLVDDCCPLGTGDFAKKSKFYPNKISIIFNKKNLGVGGAVKNGYSECLKDNSDIIVKIDGDNQMSPSEINKIVEPLLSNNFDYSKGNRFLNSHQIDNYPTVRFYGNIFLSFMSKLSSGYWDIYDPINGFTAIDSKILKKLNLDEIDNGYYFESDMLYNLYILRGKVKDVPIKIKYFKNQIQNMNLIKESFNFFFKNLLRTFSRVNKSYFQNNFSIGSFFASSFIITLLFTIFYGGYNYIHYSMIDKFAPTGVVLISSIFFLIMFLSLMIFLIIDNFNNPNKT